MVYLMAKTKNDGLLYIGYNGTMLEREPSRYTLLFADEAAARRFVNKNIAFLQFHLGKDTPLFIRRDTLIKK